jgi:hypothetical protein
LPGRKSFGFFRYDHYPDESDIVTRNDVQAPAIWNYLTTLGVPSIVVNVPVTYPAEPIDGVLIPGDLSPADAPGYPTDVRDELRQAVGEYQAVQVLVAEMDATLAGARHLVYDSAAEIAAGAGDTRLSSRAKYVASDAAEFVTRNAIQVHGGKGYSAALPLERYYRDAKILSIIGGTTEIQQTTVARQLLGL